jgi:hypothetical protein
VTESGGCVSECIARARGYVGKQFVDGLPKRFQDGGRCRSNADQAKVFAQVTGHTSDWNLASRRDSPTRLHEEHKFLVQVVGRPRR